MVMDLRISTLNPYAPAFDPIEFREVEDFSPKWWELVKTSKWFRDFWLCTNSEDEFGADEFSDAEDQFDEMIESTKTTESSFILTHHPKTLLEALNLLESPKTRGPKSPEFSPKHQDKPAKFVTPKFSARRTRQICQPR